MLKIYCMFDNHTFASVDMGGKRDDMLRQIGRLMCKNGGASFFVRDRYDATISALDWHSHDDPAGSGDWIDRVLTEESFQKIMAA